MGAIDYKTMGEDAGKKTVDFYDLKVFEITIADENN